MYEIIFSKNALQDIKAFVKSGNAVAVKKLRKLLDELKINPLTGTGNPKPLGYDRAGQWSRRITGKHRLVYSVEHETVTVHVLAVAGHYDDK
ncbi:MAG: Txe/YoeB family addiction module toxin [Tannerella sp.]|jgi:toxin YoeB|nr:Txe/YoeB family addiction module toxin [Tannerella sp.]